MSETMVVAMVMPHCNILLQLARLPGNTCSSFQAGKKMTEEGREEETRGETRAEGSAAGSTRMLINLSRQFVLHYAGDNAQDHERTLKAYVNTQACIEKQIHARVSTYTQRVHIRSEIFIQGHMQEHRATVTKMDTYCICAPTLQYVPILCNLI